MSYDRLPDDDLKAALRSVRDAYDGTNAESNLTLQRALFRTRTRERKSRLTRWVVLPIAAVLAASTAWAGVTGKLAPAVGSLLEAFHPEGAPHASPATTAAVLERAAPPAAVAPVETAETADDPPAEVPNVVATSPAPPEAQAHPPTIVRHEPRPSSATPAPVIAPIVEPVVAEAPPAPSASAPDPHASLFEEAHRLHFIDRDPARALAAWDRYLAAAPHGRFAPEARYNRALALVRLGRVAEAKAELATFAEGTYGSYRREEAKQLLDALSRDASRP